MAIVGLGIVAGVAWIATSRGAPPVRSAILITIDTLRADHLASYGYTRRTSPALDAFFERGTRFEFAFSTCSQTAPSHGSLLTGKYPRFHTAGVHNAKYIMTDADETLAELCRAEGLRTGAVVSNFVLHRRFGLAQGFDDYEDEFPDRERNRSMPEQIAEHAIAKALEQIEEVRGDRFFLWFHLQDPHGPYDPPATPEPRFAAETPPGVPDRELPVGQVQDGHRAIPAYQVFGDERSVGQYMRRYDEEISYTDRQLERLFEALETAGLLDETIVAITSDHGEAFGEDGFYFSHGHSLGPDQTRVPLAFIGPGVKAGRIVDQPVSNITIFATLMNALGVDADPVIEQSVSLWPSLTSDEETPAGAGFASSWAQDAAFDQGMYLRRDRFHRRDRQFRSGPLPTPIRVQILPGEQFHRLGDGLPLEVIAEGTPIDGLRGSLREFVRQSDGTDRVLEPDRVRPGAMDEDDAEKLRQLGYLKPKAK